MDYKNGVLAGLIGGVVSGIVMHLAGAMTSIAAFLSSGSIGAAWVFHLLVSAVLGALYLHTLARQVKSGKMSHAVAGLVYGAIWYVVGGLTLMPLLQGQGLLWSASGISGTALLLIGYLVYGLFLGLSYERLQDRSAKNVEQA